MKLISPAIFLTAVLGLAACGGSGMHQVATVPTGSPATATTGQSSTPASPPAVLTIKQAARAFLRIGNPSNRLSEAINRDYSDAAPFSQYRADALALVKALNAASRKFRALRWPATVQPYITAMLLTYVPAFIRCAKGRRGGQQYGCGGHYRGEQPGLHGGGRLDHPGHNPLAARPAGRLRETR